MVMEEIVSFCRTASMVMSRQSSRNILQEVFQVSPRSKIDLIPHGIPDSALYGSLIFIRMGLERKEKMFC